VSYSNLLQYPPHKESPPSQSERLREAAGPGWEGWALIAAATAVGVALAVLVGMYAAARGVSGLAG
jgi:hypothetical protein